MRIHADWLGQADERILEFLQENGNHQAVGIHEQMTERGIEYHQNHIRRECRKLADYGLVQNVGGSTWSITEAGEAFLAGELDARSLDGD